MNLIKSFNDFEHTNQILVYEETTNILLGLMQGEIKDDRLFIKLPLADTAHWGCQFPEDERFVDGIEITHDLSAPLAQYITAKVSDFYFNGGKQKRKTLIVKYADWKKYVNSFKSKDKNEN